MVPYWKKNDPPGNLMSSCGHRMPQVKTRHGGLLNLPIKHTSFIWGVSEDVNMVIKEGILLYLVFKQTHLITTGMICYEFQSLEIHWISQRLGAQDWCIRPKSSVFFLHCEGPCCRQSKGDKSKQCYAEFRFPSSIFLVHS